MGTKGREKGFGKDYYVYDTKDNDRLCGIFKVYEAAKFFECTYNNIIQANYRGSLIKHRYRIVGETDE